MNHQNSIWFMKDFLLHRDEKSVQITVLCKAKCFSIQLSPANFDRSPVALEKYIQLMDSVCNDDDYDLAEEAEQNLQEWAVQSFLPIFDQIEPPQNPHRPYTLQDYLLPKTYRYLLYTIDEQPKPCLDYEVPRWSASGVDLHDFELCSTLSSFLPDEIELRVTSYEELFSRSPTQVFANGHRYYLKPVHYGDEKSTLRELSTYKGIEIFCSSKKVQVQVPRLYGIVRDQQTCNVIGLLLSFIDCRSKTLECALKPGTPLPLREKWDMQRRGTLACLHEAGIVWGDAKAANILIDVNDDAWIIDFGGGYTEGWVRKDQMETMKGDQEGLVMIREFLHQGQ